MRMKMLWYDVEVIWKPGKDMFVPDALSRAPVRGAVKEIELNDKAEVYSVVSQLPITREKLIEFRTATANDPTLQQLISVVMDGWPSERSKVSETIKPYFPFKDEIVYCDGLLFRGNQIIVPKCLQSEMLSRIHESHQGIVKTKRRARGVLFWPGMNSQIEDATSKCAEFRKAQPAEPLISHDIPNRPWSKIAADFFHHKGHDYLIIVDYYSKFPEVIKVPSTKSQTAIYAMQSVFSRTGIPDELITDNGPPFNGAEFAQFAKKWEFHHVTSSPGFPQSNGQVERCVQTVKNLIKKAEKAGENPFLSLLEYRNTPLDGTDGFSPAQLLNSRLLRSRVPTALPLLKPHVVPPMKNNLKVRQSIQKFYHDQHAQKELPKPQVGDPIRFKNPKGNWEYATIQGESNAPRSFIVQTPDGRSYRRNRNHKFKTREQAPSDTPQLSDNTLVNPNIVPNAIQNIKSAANNNYEQISDNTGENEVITEMPVITRSPIKATRSGRVSKPPIRLIET